jgi:hypothetical protein
MDDINILIDCTNLFLNIRKLLRRNQVYFIQKDAISKGYLLYTLIFSPLFPNLSKMLNDMFGINNSNYTI